MSYQVKFHRVPNLTFQRAKEEAYVNNWVLAGVLDIQEEINNFTFNQPFSVGWVREGLLAAPVLYDISSLKRGVNYAAVDWEMEPLSPYKEVYPTKGINEGFFYLEGKPRNEADKPAPGTYREEPLVGGGTVRYSPEEWNRKIRRDAVLNGPYPERIVELDYDNFNVMIDGWYTDERPLLEAAAAALLKSENRTQTLLDGKLLSMELKVDPVRRYQYAPFLLRELYNALRTTNPNPAQAAYQKRFNFFTTCKQWLYSTSILEDWKTHTGASDATIGKLPNGQFTAPTMSVWRDALHDRATKRGFIAMDIADRYKTPKGSLEVAKLFGPALANEVEEMDNGMNLKAIGGNMHHIVGAMVGTSTALTCLAIPGSIIFADALEVQLRSIGQKARLVLKREWEAERALEAVARETGETSSNPATKKVVNEAAEEVAEKGSKKVTKKMVKIAMRKTLGMLTGQKLSRPAAKAAEKAATQIMTKLGSRIAVGAIVVGFIAMAGEILAGEIADILNAINYDKELREAAEWHLDNVSDFLNPSTAISGEELNARKTAVLHDLIYFIFSLPAERGILSFEYPEIPLEYGKTWGINGKQYYDVKFFQVYDQGYAHLQEMAASRNMRIATEAEVAQAIIFLGLSGPRGYASLGINGALFVRPVSEGFYYYRGVNYPMGLNSNAPGENDGFYYVEVEPVPGVVKTPVQPQPTQRLPDREPVKIQNVRTGEFIVADANGNLRMSSQPATDREFEWELFNRDEYIELGKVRFLSTRLKEFLRATPAPEVGGYRADVGRVVSDPTFFHMGNYGQWILHAVPGYLGIYLIQSDLGNKPFLHNPQGSLWVSAIDVNDNSSHWRILRA